MSRKKPDWKKKLQRAKGSGASSKTPPEGPYLEPMKMRRPPQWFGMYARKFWNRIAPQLIELGLLTELDVVTFEMLCVMYQRTMQSRDELEKEGTTTVDERGLQRKHPLWQIYRESMNQFVLLCGDFGLQPTKRLQLNIRAMDLNDDMTKYLKRKD